MNILNIMNIKCCDIYDIYLENCSKYFLSRFENTQFNLKNLISRISFLDQKRNKLLLCINLKLQLNQNCSFWRMTSHFSGGLFLLRSDINSF